MPCKPNPRSAADAPAPVDRAQMACLSSFCGMLACESCGRAEWELYGSFGPPTFGKYICGTCLNDAEA